MGTSANIDPARKGVTLVEILVVIVIIGILTGLIMGALGPARRAARRAAIKVEISNIHMGLDNYKTEYTESLPTFQNIDIVLERAGDLALEDDGRRAVLRHLRKAFPRYVPGAHVGADLEGRITASSDDYDGFAADVFYAYGGVVSPMDGNPGSIDPLKFDAASTILFFVGGLPEVAPVPGQAWVPAGFHSDPTFPFRPGLPRTEPLHEFDPERIVYHEWHHSDPFDITSLGVDRYLRYYPEGAPGADASPLVYFKSRRIRGLWQYGSEDSTYVPPPPLPNFYQQSYSHSFIGSDLTNHCVPYRDPESQIRWRNYETFQIICPGLDGDYGGLLPSGVVVLPYNLAGPGFNRSRYRTTRTGGNFTDGDYDNLTNFSAKTLEDELE